jgi:hypothetical protein
MRMKKLLLQLLRAPLSLTAAIMVGVRLVSPERSEKIYVFDFDNTLARTADHIAKSGTYDYRIQELRLYSAMLSYLSVRLKRGHRCLVLSARPRYQRQDILELLESNGIYVDVQVVDIHWLKAIPLAVVAAHARSRVVVIDDMMSGEETGRPRRLFFPMRIFSKKFRLITHERVVKLR